MTIKIVAQYVFGEKIRLAPAPSGEVRISQGCAGRALLDARKYLFMSKNKVHRYFGLVFWKVPKVFGYMKSYMNDLSGSLAQKSATVVSFAHSMFGVAALAADG